MYPYQVGKIGNARRIARGHFFGLVPFDQGRKSDSMELLLRYLRVNFDALALGSPFRVGLRR
jgi:hypothetical protein